ncbi:MAG TPA: response regulator transcription factor [Acetobacteraceae bacterium]|nr:response regulator transcription factor [Acetobacteraceae bacterium]
MSDPCRLFREGLAGILAHSNFSVIASGETLAEALGPQSVLDRPEIALCGFADGTDVEESLREMDHARARVPELRVIILAGSVERDLLARAVDRGIDGVLSKNISVEVLRLSLELVMLGQQLFPATAIGSGEVRLDTSIRAAALPQPGAPDVADSSLGRIPLTPVEPGGTADVLLSDREDQVLRGLVEGAPNKLIARDLGITEATVKVHIKSLLRKLHAANRTQAAIWGISRGLGRDGEAPSASSTRPMCATDIISRPALRS